MGLLGLNKISRERFFFVDIKSKRVYMRIVTVSEKVWIAAVDFQVLGNSYVRRSLHIAQEKLTVKDSVQICQSPS